jgi:predicted unusual protein kinase regulating ubiquinone biosynthesis (AarF/ABC1/UbiB family)
MAGGAPRRALVCADYISSVIGCGISPQVVLLDAGLCVELKAIDQRNFVDLFAAVGALVLLLF